MPVSTVGWLAVGTIALLYSTLKLVKWSLNAQEDLGDSATAVRAQHVNHVWSAFKLFVGAAIALEFGPGVASWLVDAWRVATSIL